MATPVRAVGQHPARLCLSGAARTPSRLRLAGQVHESHVRSVLWMTVATSGAVC
ncbi:hypothetical protein [Blastococcus atacamensis]|uniref:hypothetical protein n=1 Tax=Blastococcus atacamensis TaxID=2070508 RepID=UPI0012FFFF30|nr:hypothetical protein [Blastococcus atacamensis]